MKSQHKLLSFIKLELYEIGRPRTYRPTFFSTVNCKMVDLPVRNGETSIHRSLQGSEHLIASGGSGKSCIQVASESSRLSINALHIKLVPGDLHLAVIYLVKAKFVQQLEESTQFSSYNMCLCPCINYPRLN